MSFQLLFIWAIPRFRKYEHDAVFADYRHTHLPTILQNESILTELSLVFRKAVQMHTII